MAARRIAACDLGVEITREGCAVEETCCSRAARCYRLRRDDFFVDRDLEPVMLSGVACVLERHGRILELDPKKVVRRGDDVGRRFGTGRYGPVEGCFGFHGIIGIKGIRKASPCGRIGSAVRVDRIEERDHRPTSNGKFLAGGVRG